jgi:holdfast attachment protein HfaA
MTHSWKIFIPALAAASLAIGLAGPAWAGAWSNSAAYNGYGASIQNQPSNYSMRDQYGNLTLVNGRVTPSIYSAQSGGGSQYANSYAGGVGTGGAGTVGEAYAIGNQLNVTVVGTHNTTIINSDQTNNGNQSATAALNAK